jgi:hypothetical protein
MRACKRSTWFTFETTDRFREVCPLRRGAARIESDVGREACRREVSFFGRGPGEEVSFRFIVISSLSAPPTQAFLRK